MTKGGCTSYGYKIAYVARRSNGELTAEVTTIRRSDKLCNDEQRWCAEDSLRITYEYMYVRIIAWDLVKDHSQ